MKDYCSLNTSVKRMQQMKGQNCIMSSLGRTKKVVMALSPCKASKDTMLNIDRYPSYLFRGYLSTIYLNSQSVFFLNSKIRKVDFDKYMCHVRCVFNGLNQSINCF